MRLRKSTKHTQQEAASDNRDRERKAVAHGDARRKKKKAPALSEVHGIGWRTRDEVRQGVDAG